MKTDLNITISNSDEARAFLLALCENKEAYHPEDRAEDIIIYVTGEKAFTDDEAENLNLLMADVYQHADFDPCEVILIASAL